MTNKSIILLMITSLLSGCATPQLIFKDQSINLPVAQYQCQEPATRPSGNVIMESQVAKYIASLEKVVPDCKLRLIEIQKIIECYNDRKCNVPSLMKGLDLAEDRLKG